MNVLCSAVDGPDPGGGARRVAAVHVPEIYVVLPGRVDDPASPSGGNSYDRRVCAGLGAAGWSVRPVPVPGNWPVPGDADRTRLDDVLDGIPGGATVLLDGLVAGAVPEVVLPQARRLRLVVLVHLPLADETGLAPALAADLDARERRTLRAAAMVVATSAAVGRHLIAHHGLPAERVRVVTPGADRAPCAPGTPGGGQLLYIASVTPRKGLDVLVEALTGVADLPWTCVCAGPLDRDPGYADRVRRLVVSRGLQARVRWLGPRTDGDVAELYTRGDLLVLPSRAEPYGMVVTEALARGLPVLATAVGGVPEALGQTPDGELPGVLVPPGEPDALAVALRRWLGEPALRDRLRAAARRRSTTLPSWDGTISTLSEVLGNAGRAG